MLRTLQTLQTFQNQDERNLSFFFKILLIFFPLILFPLKGVILGKKIKIFFFPFLKTLILAKLKLISTGTREKDCNRKNCKRRKIDREKNRAKADKIVTETQKGTF